MAQQLINVGTIPNDGTGDAIRLAGIKVNENFTDVFEFEPVKSDISFDGNNIKTKSSNADIELRPSGAGSVQLGAGIRIDDNNIVAIRSNDNISIVPSGTGNLNIAGLAISGNNIYSVRSNDNIGFVPSGTGNVVFGAIKISGTTISSDDSATININDGLIVDGTATIEGASTLAALVAGTTLAVTTAATTLSSTLSVAGTTTLTTTNIDNLNILDNYITSDSNADIDIAPGGTGDVVFPSITIHNNNITTTQSNDDIRFIPGGGGSVNITSLTIDSGIKLFDNKIQTIQSNAILELDANGSGTVDFTSETTTGLILSYGNVGITGTETITGQMNVEGITIKDNAITTNDSNAPLIISGNGSGSVVIDDVDIGGGAIDNVVIGATTPAAGTFTTLVFSPTNTGTLSADGVTITDNIVKASDSNDNLELNANGSGYVSINAFQFPNADGGTGQLLTTNASKVLTWATSPVLLGSSDIQDGTSTIAFSSETEVDDDITTGKHELISSTQRTIDSFTTSEFDSAWYHGVLRDDISDEFEAVKYSLQHGITSDGSTRDAYLTVSGLTKTGTNNHIIAAADISGSDVRLLGTGSSPENSMSWYRVGLGDDTSTATSGKISTHAGVTLGGVSETEVDHVIAEGTITTLQASEKTVSSFTASQFNGALYHIVSRDLNGTSFEIQKISVLHNFNDSFVTSSSIVQTDPADQHPTFTTDFESGTDSTSTVRLRATDSDGSSTPSNTMAYYRIGIGDDDSTGYLGELGLVHDIMHTSIIDSTVTNLDTWTHASHVGAKYFINVKNQSTGECSNIEALVTHNNTDAFITTYNEHFSGNNSLITLTADIDGTSVRLRGSATAGASTKVIVNRIVAFGDTEATEAANDDSTRKVIGNVVTSSTATTFDTFQSSDTDAVHYVITGQGGTNENYICEADVVTDGTGVFVSQGPSISTKTGEIELLIITATISGGTVSVKAASTSGASVVQAYAVRLKAPASQIQVIDSWTSGSNNRGAKYYVSAKDTVTGYTSNIEALVTHNGTDAFISSYNEHYSNISLVTLTADISGGNVRLLGLPSIGNVKIKFYKILLADNESDSTGTNTKVIGAVTVSSTATAIDTFLDESGTATGYTAAHYVIVGYNSGESGTPASICEAIVVTNGTNVFVTQGPVINTKGTDQLILSVVHDGSSTVTLKAASTSGGSTTVNAYRVHLERGAGAGSTTTLNTFAKATFRSAAYNMQIVDATAGSYELFELRVTHDGTNAYVSKFGRVSNTASETATISADISGADVRIRGTISTVNEHVVKYVRKIIKV